MCKNDIFLWNKDRLKLGSGFARGGAVPFIPDESSASNEEWGVSSDWVIKRPGDISLLYRHFERSEKSLSFAARDSRFSHRHRLINIRGASLFLCAAPPFLISNFSFEQSVHPQSMGVPPTGSPPEPSQQKSSPFRKSSFLRKHGFNRCQVLLLNFYTWRGIAWRE